jgi:hypothetical protein
MADQNTYFDQMAPRLQSMPLQPSDLDTAQMKNMIDMGAFSDAMKQRVLQAVQQAYLRQGNFANRPEQYGQGTASVLAQYAATDKDF